ncbi:hypothetical protein H4R33_005592 [Dimargaris cristalligena]|uniref:Sphingomyelin synthase-like domain-containing protein n=1 Tax=Dimargaris cristalligena TaxID=215637 RepID=A0A4P9ZQP5_9FUNG|nr:hypothetical protein H4R33_005592 [Dimargaris cristalligena]RKP34740.1 hypothetical protein BJ085DRAFT_38279 [Dimargaris cristalligena]|eukprot:RKP34740.1 hypothetical protein BJ085DRAFT_38279 [Dimargaris cristalligena]
MANSDFTLSEVPRQLVAHMAKAPKQVNRWEVLRTLLALLYLFLVAYFMVFMQQFSDRRWRQDDPKLRDLAFDWFPFVDKVDIADALVTSSLAFVVFGNLFLLTNWRNRIIFVRRCLWLIGTLYFFRAFTLIVTTLPSPRDCVPPISYDTAEMFRIGLEMIISKTKACTDNIYSGHTVILVSSFMLWRIHCKYAIIIGYVFCHTVAGVIMVLFTHLHYFVDILLAIFYTYSIFSMYFYALDLAVHNYYKLTPHRLHCSCQPPASKSERFVGFFRYQGDPEKADSVYGNGDRYANPDAPSQVTISPAQMVDAAEYRRVAFTPRILNNWIPHLIGWMDGLDLRTTRPGLPSPGGGCPVHPPKYASPVPMNQVYVS